MLCYKGAKMYLKFSSSLSNFEEKNTHQSKFSTACFIIDFNFAFNLFTIMS